MRQVDLCNSRIMSIAPSTIQHARSEFGVAGRRLLAIVSSRKSDVATLRWGREMADDDLDAGRRH
jgi:hypothetical protein